MALYCMYVTTMAFFARVCDPKIGGSYMTLLNTVSNFGECCFQVMLYAMYVAVMAFNAKISDPSIGGTYMTLLNTLTNLGKNFVPFG